MPLLIEWLGYFTLAYFIGKFIGWVFTKWLEERTDEKLVQKMVDDAVEKILKVHIRWQNGIFYAYEAESDEFLAQGDGLEQMVINIRENTKRQHVIFVSSDDSAYPHVKEFLESKLGKPIDSHVSPGA